MPLGSDGNQDDARLTSQQRRASRLRHASPEERLEALRQYRSQAQDWPFAGEDYSDRRRCVKLADKLHGKFRIRRRPQLPDRS